MQHEINGKNSRRSPDRVQCAFLIIAALHYSLCILIILH